jgi:glycosyl-4,4'-diaponeurosporenoate acyltransferase
MEREGNKNRGREEASMMRLVYLPTFWTIVIDCIAWFVIHMGVVLFIIHVPSRFFNLEGWLYRIRRWEKSRDIYTKIFKIKKWKEYLPDGSKLLKYKSFPKKHLGGKNEPFFNSFLTETCRAELTHWIIMLFAPLFFLWNKPGVGLIMVFYALIENLPLILAQRYNRIRLKRVLEKEIIKS